MHPTPCVRVFECLMDEFDRVMNFELSFDDCF